MDLNSVEFKFNVVTKIEHSILNIEQWIENFNTMKGGVHLERGINYANDAIDILDEMDGTGYRLQNRILTTLSFFSGMAHNITGSDRKLGFGAGVNAHKYLDEMRLRLDELTQIHEYIKN